MRIYAYHNKSLLYINGKNNPSPNYTSNAYITNYKKYIYKKQIAQLTNPKKGKEFYLFAKNNFFDIHGYITYCRIKNDMQVALFL